MAPHAILPGHVPRAVGELTRGLPLGTTAEPPTD